jgi:hypothetical protein
LSNSAAKKQKKQKNVPVQEYGLIKMATARQTLRHSLKNNHAFKVSILRQPNPGETALKPLARPLVSIPLLLCRVIVVKSLGSMTQQT